MGSSQRPVRTRSSALKVSSSRIGPTLITDREDAQCEDDDSALVLSSDDGTGELSSENVNDDYRSNRTSNYRSCH